jgi:two-component system sensor histidine kinase UhpB
VKARGLKREHNDVTPNQYTFRLLTKTGATVWVDMRAIRAMFGGQPCVLGNFIDITPSRQAEAEIRHLSRRLIEAIEEERKRLAADLHDEYGQILTSLHLDLEALERAFPPEQLEQIEACRRLIGQIENLAQTVRDTTSRLRPDLLDHLGLVPTLEWYIADFMQRRPDIQVEFQTVGLKRRLSPQIEIVLYRTFQECLTNISRHARAHHVSITLACSYPRLIFSVRDDGIGFSQKERSLSPGPAPQGIGLLSMRERVAVVGGTLDIHSMKGKGTTVRVELPLGRD